MGTGGNVNLSLTVEHDGHNLHFEIGIDAQGGDGEPLLQMLPSHQDTESIGGHSLCDGIKF